MDPVEPQPAIEPAPARMDPVKPAPPGVNQAPPPPPWVNPQPHTEQQNITGDLVSLTALTHLLQPLINRILPPSGDQHGVLGQRQTIFLLSHQIGFREAGGGLGVDRPDNKIY